jgi:drug/metabolite transporter (DMT)-like permease
VQTRAAGRPEWITWMLLSAGVAAASASAILIRYALAAPPLAISFWRCAGAAALLAPFARRDIVSALPPKLPAIAGVFLAVHFATWITSLELTSVASSVLLVSTTPIFVALVAWGLFKEPLRALGWAGIGLSFAGTALITGVGDHGSSTLGNALALAGGATAGAYVIAGGRARKRLGIAVYAALTYALAAAVLLVVCVIAGVRLWGWSASTWWAIVAIVVGPQLVGHTAINLVLADLDATTVAVSIMAEPVIAIALAFVLLGETPSLLVYPGGAAILAGIYVTSSARPRSQQAP